LKSRDLRFGGANTYTNNGSRSVILVPGAKRSYFSVANDTASKGEHKKPNPQEFYKLEADGLSGSIIWSTGSQIGDIYSTDSSIDWGAGWDSAAETMAYNNALSKLTEKVRGNLDLSIDLLQAGETFRMVKSVDRLLVVAKALKGDLKSISRIKSGFKTLNMDSALRATRSVGSGALEVQYGWRPLVQDVYEAAQKVVTKYREVPFCIEATARTKSAYSNIDGILTSGVRNKYSGAWSYRYKFGIYLLPSQSRLQALSGWATLNPASMAWEVLPYSFVVDWVFNVGGYLRNLETAWLHCDRFHSGYYTLTRRHDQKCKMVGRSSFGELYDLNGWCQRSDKIRTVLTSYPLPRFPSLSLNLGSERLLNAAALLSQFLRR